MSTQGAGQGGAAWLPDPAGRFDQRYWDGAAWTTAVMRGNAVLSDVEGVPEVEAGSSLGSPAFQVPQPLPSQPAVGHVPTNGPWDRFTSLAPEEAQRRLLPMLQMEGWQVTSTAPGQLDLQFIIRGRRPHFGIGCLLTLLFVIPGIIYGIMARLPKRIQASMTFVPVDSGTRIAIGGELQAVEKLGRVLAALPW